MDMRQLMKQAQDMQANMEKVQAQLAEERLEASAGGGMVSVTANGAGDILSVRIDPAAIDPDDVEMLEDMVLAAVNEASRQAGALAQQRMGAVTGGMNLPGM